MIKHSTEQKQIVDWFNNTYTKRGEWYLRPKHAYYIYLEVLNAKANQKLLDIACGLGRLLEASLEYNVVPSGIDISDVAIAKVKAKFPQLDVSVANAEELPFEDNSFDLLTCIGSLERMIDKDKVLNEFLRVGKKECRYCFLVRNSQSTNWMFFKKFLGLKNKAGHQDAMDYNSWSQLFTKAGFNISNVYPDQYPLMKRLKRRSFWLKTIDYKSVVTSKTPIEKAKEFLFILEKK